MTFHVDRNWWKDIFDEVYLETDARSVCDADLTRREVAFIEARLAPDKSDRILDVCGGQGRHALELARRGYARTAVLDYSRCLVRTGRRQARRRGLPTAFIRGDARRLGVASGSVRFILLMGGSFGYFIDQEENLKYLTEIFRVLEKGGKVLLDLPDRAYILRHFAPASRHCPTDDLVVRRTRKLENDVIFSLETISSVQNGLIRENAYCTRIYSGQTITDLLRRAGFADISVEKEFMCRNGRGDFGSMTSRMAVIAQKPGSVFRFSSP